MIAKKALDLKNVAQSLLLWILFSTFADVMLRVTDN